MSCHCKQVNRTNFSAGDIAAKLRAKGASEAEIPGLVARACAAVSVPDAPDFNERLRERATKPYDYPTKETSLAEEFVVTPAPSLNDRLAKQAHDRLTAQNAAIRKIKKGA